jgi:hypothetical protein
MSASPIDLLHQAIAQAAIPAGFRKKGSSWYCDGARAILVINPQKSQYGPQWFLNLGIYWRDLGGKTEPREEQCHVRGRISAVLSAEEGQQIEQALNFEDLSFEHEARANVVRDALSRHAIPLLTRCSTTAGLREEFHKGALRRFLVARELASLAGM